MEATTGIVMQHAIHFRCVRTWMRIQRTILDMHPSVFERWCRLMFLGFPVLALPTVALLDVPIRRERSDGWVLLHRGAGDVADRAGWPIRLREDDATGQPVVGCAVGGANRSGDLWGLVVWLRDDETEASASFQERCREARQVHGLDPVCPALPDLALAAGAV
jgi:hypothetical protein